MLLDDLHPRRVFMYFADIGPAVYGGRVAMTRRSPLDARAQAARAPASMTPITEVDIQI